MRPRDLLFWTLVAAFAVLWVGGVVVRVVPSAGPSPVWAAPAFLAIAAGIASMGARDVRAAGVFAVGGFLAEAVGVNTGLPFGAYVYTDRLGPRLGGAPIAIAFAWIVVLLFSREAAGRLAARRPWMPLAGAAIATAFDLLIDPVATRVLGYWEWRQPGPYFGVPLVNFAGWFLVSAALVAAAGAPRSCSRSPLVVGASIAIFFAAMAAA